MTHNTDAAYWVKQLGLEPHPEGGFYKETYRSTEKIAAAALPKRFTGPRSCSTAIYFLLTSDTFSAFHRIKADEMWHFHEGSRLLVHMIHDNGEAELIRLGKNPTVGETLQAVVPANTWFASEVAPGGSFSLSGCTVAPGFDFDDFEMGKRETLVKQFPAHKTLLERLTRVRA